MTSRDIKRASWALIINTLEGGTEAQQRSNDLVQQIVDVHQAGDLLAATIAFAATVWVQHCDGDHAEALRQARQGQLFFAALPPEGGPDGS